MNTPRPNLSKAFASHAKKAQRVWVRTPKGKYYSREVTPDDKKRWLESEMDYANGTYKTHR